MHILVQGVNYSKVAPFGPLSFSGIPDPLGESVGSGGGLRDFLALGFILVSR